MEPLPRQPLASSDRPNRTRLIVSALIFLVVFLVVMFFFRQRSAVIVSSKVVTYSVKKPKEKPVEEGQYKWRGSPDEPQRIELPSLNKEGFVQKVGVDQDKRMAVPTNIHLAGWFVDSVRPGTDGLSIIAGHVNGPTSDDAIFTKLGELERGAEFSVVLGSGRTVEYRVIEVNDYPEAEAANHLFSQKPSIKRQLNLITCSGDYDKEARTFTERTIVTAEEVVPLTY